jgi:hypothetical protein
LPLLRAVNGSAKPIRLSGAPAPSRSRVKA